MKQAALSLFLILLSGLVLCFMAINNGFPLAFNVDSQMYISSAFTGVVRDDRPILYGLFIMFVSLRKSLWLVTIAQAILTSTMIYFYFRYSKNQVKKRLAPFYIAYIALVSFFMGASFEVGWLMSDVFASIFVLGIGLLLFYGNIKWYHHALISFMTVLSIAMHNSHLYICIILCSLLMAGFVFKSTRAKLFVVGITLKKVFYVLFLAVLSNVSLSLIQYSFNKQMAASKGGVVFLFGSFVEMGVIDKYLDENCNRSNLKLCKFRDSIPSNFLWDQRSPLFKLGGWDKNREEYSLILKNIVSSPKYWGIIAYKSTLLTLKQFFQFDTGEASKPWPIVNEAVEQYFPSDYSQYISSRQNKEALNFDFINFTQRVIIAISLLTYIYEFLHKKMASRYRYLMAFILIVLVVNAWFCGTVSGVYPRYQSRLIWLVPLPLFIYLSDYTPLKRIRALRFGQLLKYLGFN
ncbi:hypothetical protein ACFFGT_02345 [Mucilaginibacter angelicae]|uniref:Glycosyltransferase RgtA/B/C/D-like domain-containing protein n=1 Tax=Mucilaginibacter angelicae TaxID=869718 RepID=A0ABV6KZW6_9SPHI